MTTLKEAIFLIDMESLVSNQASYDIMVIPRELKNIDTLEFCKLLKITKEDYIKQ
jgi:penicillin-binding protein 2